jgi:hypothetical protein
LFFSGITGDNRVSVFARNFGELPSAIAKKLISSSSGLYFRLMIIIYRFPFEARLILPAGREFQGIMTNDT